MKKWNLIPGFLSLVLLLLASLFAMRDGMQITWWSLGEIVIICMVISLFVTVTYYNKITMIAGLLLGSIVEACFFMLRFEVIRAEFLKIFYHIIPMVNRFYQTNFSGKNHFVSEDSNTLLVAVILFFGLLLGAGIKYKKYRWITMLPVILAFIGGFLLGYAPKIGAILCLIFGLGIQMFVLKEQEFRINRNAVIISFLSLSVTMGVTGLIYKPVANKLLENYESVREYQNSLWDRTVAFFENISHIDGTLWDMGYGQKKYAELTNKAPDLSSDIIFTITVESKPQNVMYLKEFVGVTYENGVWYPTDENNFNDFAKQLNIDADKFGEAVYNAMYNPQYQRNFIEEISIQIKKRTGNISLMPYYANIPENADMIGDVGYRVLEKEYEVRQFNVDKYTNYLASSFFDETTIERNPLYIKHQKAYMKYAKKYYTDVPAEQLPKLVEDPEEAQRILQQECTYSFDLQSDPKEQDIIEYFLFEQKKGYCMHFATAQTLLLRLEGVPARYVGGYIVLKDDFQKNADGTYTATVTEQRAHAWVEYLDEEKGWCIKEATPHAYFTELDRSQGTDRIEDIVGRLDGITSNPATPQDSQTPGKQENPDEPKLPEDSNIPDDPDKQNDRETSKDDTEGTTQEPGAIQKENRILLKIVFWIVIAVLFLVLLMKLRRKVICHRRKHKFYSSDKRKGASEIVKETLGILKILGITIDEYKDEMIFAKETEEQLPCLKDGEFVHFVENARIIRYGNAEIEKEQWNDLYVTYKKLMNYVLQQMKWYQRVWYRNMQIKF